ncbi:hypothetical protein HAX54_006283 [Datura stramonium]|uniref:Uncharacterized protein n=1 Tax=Datura stramonium TaxID=4076 RepID=A0ABS8TA34_DATST|nr:hypothetical protein [Datura stramonium]
MITTIPGQFFLKPPNYLLKGVLQTPVGVGVTVRTRKANNSCAPSLFSNLFFVNHGYGVNPRLCSGITWACNDGAGEVYVNPQQSSPADSSFNTGDGYIALFVRMLGLDHDPLDENRHFRGSVNLTVGLLRSESDAACEAAAGLLRMTSSVKEQSLCMLIDLSVDEKLRNKIANSDLLPLLISSWRMKALRVKEAAGGVLANLALSASNHKNIIEAGVIPKLVRPVDSCTFFCKDIYRS